MYRLVRSWHNVVDSDYQNLLQKHWFLFSPWLHTVQFYCWLPGYILTRNRHLLYRQWIIDWKIKEIWPSSYIHFESYIRTQWNTCAQPEGGGNWGRNLRNLQMIGLFRNSYIDVSGKPQNYPVGIQCMAIINPLAQHLVHGVSLVG